MVKGDTSSSEDQIQNDRGRRREVSRSISREHSRNRDHSESKKRRPKTPTRLESSFADEKPSSMLDLMPTYYIPWNSATERSVKTTGERSGCMAYMCEIEADYYSSVNNTMMIIAIVLGSLTGIANFATIDPSLDSIYLKIGIGVLTMFIGCWSAIVKKLGYDKQHKEFKKSASKFRKIQSDIITILGHAGPDRPDPVKYVQLVLTKYDKQVEKCGGIRSKTVAALKLSIDGKNVSIPEVAGGVAEIDIYRPDTHDSITSRRFVMNPSSTETESATSISQGGKKTDFEREKYIQAINAHAADAKFNLSRLQ